MPDSAPRKNSKLFGFGGKGKATASENDVESLLTLHGILCAFLVSISLGMEAGLAPAATSRTDFYGALANRAAVSRMGRRDNRP